ncbi:MAG: amidohydrolase family protein [Lewinellaceae bacterium]|nr:amidohydrolase family protein [Lewinellaceae bacterium]
MTKTILLLPGLILCFATLFAQNNTPVHQFDNGNWFDGTKFEPATWYSVDGKLTQKIPARIDAVVDLAGRWVVPPLGDAFCSSLSENLSAIQQLQAYSKEGVFYLQVLSNTREGRKRAESPARQKETPDVTFANGGFTCTLGYPFLLQEAPAQGIRNPAEWAEKYSTIREGRSMLGDAYWFVDNRKAADGIWKKALAQSPDIISIYLLDAQNNGGKETKGLTAAAAKAIIKKAHRSGLRVFAHVETAEDVRLGLKIGVDGFANLPGHNWDGTGDGIKYDLTDDDLKALAKKKTPVIPLLSRMQTQTTRPNIQQIHAKLLKRLLDNGVQVIVGSDDPQRTIRAEINYWFQFDGLDNAQAIKIFCINTPQAIFPKRKIGRFEEGYEATFLVLNDNPLQNLLKLRNIAFAVKEGNMLQY